MEDYFYGGSKFFTDLQLHLRLIPILLVCKQLIYSTNQQLLVRIAGMNLKRSCPLMPVSFFGNVHPAKPYSGQKKGIVVFSAPMVTLRALLFKKRGKGVANHRFAGTVNSD